jgi:polar amino acid transport system permease protein/cystine transport system permease protein
MASSLPFADLFQVPWSDYVGNLGAGLLGTLAYTFASFIGATLLGLVLALMRLNHLRIVRLPAGVYTEIFKNVPPLAIIFLTYFCLPSVGVKLDDFVAGVHSLVLFYAAYLSEIFRAAIAGLHPGQTEAAHAIGLGRGTTSGHVVLPQALRLALPGATRCSSI